MIRVNRKVLSHMLNYGAPLHNCVERAVGKTTQAILAALAKSYEQPGAWVLVDDPDCKTHMIAEHLVREVRDKVEKLGFGNIEVQSRGIAPQRGERGGPCAPNYRPQYPCVFIRNTFAEVLT